MSESSEALIDFQAAHFESRIISDPDNRETIHWCKVCGAVLVCHENGLATDHTPDDAVPCEDDA